MLKILFICTHNRCRSILAEAIFQHNGNALITTASAGSAPVEQVHPLSVKYLQQRGIQTDNLQSQSMQDVKAFEPDIVITVCDNAAGEACPLWLGNAIRVHWPLPDPSRLESSDDIIYQGFQQVMDALEQRARLLMLKIEHGSLNLDNRQTLPQQMQEIGAQTPCIFGSS